MMALGDMSKSMLAHTQKCLWSGSTSVCASLCLVATRFSLKCAWFCLSDYKTSSLNTKLTSTEHKLKLSTHGHWLGKHFFIASEGEVV